jgi:uncharacterized alpha-E superfamily protein
VIETKFDTLRAVESEIETTERNMHLLSVVRSCCALESFRRNAGDIDPDDIASFLLLEQSFPRSVCFAARHAHDAIRRIGRQVSASASPNSPQATGGAAAAEAILGRLYSELQYTRPDEIAGDAALRPYLAKVQQATLDAAVAVKKSYFLQ